jgi:hypothetical protein
VFVNTGMLHAGASDSRRAGDDAENGRNQLAGAPLASGMFGDFAAAEAFHAMVSSAHGYHLQTLQIHQEILSNVGRKATHVAHAFSAMEDHNKKALRDVRCT